MKQSVSVISWNHGMIGLEGSLKITQNHVITAWLGLEVSLQPPKPHPCPGLLPPLHQTRAPFMSLSTPSHGAPTLLRAAVPGSYHLLSKEFSPYTSPHFPPFILNPFPLVLSLPDKVVFLLRGVCLFSIPNQHLRALWVY